MSECVMLTASAKIPAVKDAISADPKVKNATKEKK